MSDPYSMRPTGEWDEGSLLDWLYDLLEGPEWHKQAKCRGMFKDGADKNLFYPERGDFKEVPRLPDHSVEYPARAICKKCPVQEECLEAGLYEMHGIWGGRSTRERIKMKRARGAKKPASWGARDNGAALRDLRARHKAEAAEAAARWDDAS